jgi:hypothetical protein
VRYDPAPFGFPKRPGSAPPPHGLQEAVAAGRRRLRRSALWSAGTVLSVVGIVAGATLVDGTGNDAQILVPASPVPGPEVSGTPSSKAAQSVSPTAGSTPARQRPGAGASADPAEPATGTDPEPGTGAAGDPAQVEGGGAPAAVPGTSDRRTPHREEPSTITTYGRCLNTGLADGADADDLCVQDYSASRQVRAGAETQLQVDLCASVRRSRAATLEFSTGREHDVTLLRQGSPLWTWSRAHTFPAGGHTRRLRAGNCLTWVTTWNTRDDAGRLVPPGTYTVVSSVEVNGETRSVEMEIEVTA